MHVPERFLLTVLRRIETLLVVEYGRREPGVSHYEFTVRPEHGHRVEPRDSYTDKQRRLFLRAHVPINFSIRFRGESAVIPWHDAYPMRILELRGSLADAMARNVVRQAVPIFVPGYTPF